MKTLVQFSLQEVQAQLETLSNKKIAQSSQRFFKTGPGEYGEGDLFLGIRVPVLHALSKQAIHLSLNELQILLDSKWHESRSLALMSLVLQFEKVLKKDVKQGRPFVDFYLRNILRVNNWDLVDGSAPYILGQYLLKSGEDRKILHRLAKSKNLWERRIAILSTFAFIRADEFQDTFTLCEALMDDKEDLMHKAMGWMLRELGKRNQAAEEVFLKKHAVHMPRTMLRYAIERFPEPLRKSYLAIR